MSQPILHHQQFGESGQPLIAIHGLFGSLENLGMITRQLAAEYRVYAVDLPNHGGSLHTNDMTLKICQHSPAMESHEREPIIRNAINMHILYISLVSKEYTLENTSQKTKESNNRYYRLILRYRP